MSELFARVMSEVKGAWRYRWYAVGVAWAVCIIGWIVVYSLHDHYEASARVHADTQSLLKPLLSGLTVQPDLDQQIAVMSKTLITRPNLEKVLRMVDLDIKAKTMADKEGLIDGLAARIEFKGAGTNNVYALAYWDKDPELAKKVVQALLTIFVESSLGDKRKDADQARRFIDEEIKAYEQRLVTAENALKDFKRKHIGLMPNDRQDYYTRLSQAGAALGNARLQLQEAENARDAIQSQLTGEQPVMLGEADLQEAPSRAELDKLRANPELDSRIQSLKQNLDQLRLKYTELHPDIVASRRILALLERQRQEEFQETKKEFEKKLAGESRTKKTRFSNTNPVIQQLKVSLADAEAQVASMKARVTEYEKRNNEVRALADSVPQVEADLTQLNRDYEVNKSNYEKLLSRREAAQISENMESTTAGIDFRVIDPPRVPLAPSGPNRPLLASLVLAGALVAGIAFALVFSQLKPTFSDRRSLREFTGLPVLGSVSMIWTAAQKRKSLRGNLAYGASYLILLCCYAAVMGAFLRDIRAVIS
jgi:protein tyrosine kinase modulator